jgi:uncharacterized protein YhbP (UPF0306 family)
VYLCIVTTYNKGLAHRLCYSVCMDLEKTIRKYLPQIVHLSLATSNNNKPWVCEVHFAYDEKLNLYYRSLASRRHSQEIADNPNVAGNIVKQHSLEDGVLGVYFEGTARQLTPGNELDKAFVCIKERLKAGEEVLEEAKRPDGHQFYKISVDTFYIFGNLDGSSYEKHELKWNGGEK